MINNKNTQMRPFSQKIPSCYLTIVLAVVATSIVTSIVLAYFSSSSTEIKLGNNSIIQISSRHGKMEYSDIAINHVGDTIVVWQDMGNKDYEIFAQYFDNLGSPIGMPFVVNQYKLGDQKYPKIALDGDGNFIIVWQSYKQDGNGSGIYGQRFLSNGKKVGNEFRANTYIPGNQSSPEVAMNGQGNFVIVWEGEKTDSNFQHKSVYVQRFNADGKRLGKEFRANKTLNRVQDNPSVSMDDNNNFVIVWQSTKEKDLNIYSRKFDWNEKITSGADMLINKTTEFNQLTPVITNMGSNKFIVVWQNTSQHELLEGTMLENIKGQILNSSGQKSGGEIQVTSPMLGHQENPDIVQVSSSKMFIVWEGYDRRSETPCWHIFGQMLTINGSATGDPFSVETNKDEWNQKPAIASDGNGNVGISWTSSKQNKKLVNFVRGEGV